MSATITLRCLRCEREVVVPRQSYDPPEAVDAMSYCPECLHATNGCDPETFYYDSEGDEITGEPVYQLPADFHLDAIYMTRKQKERGHECD